MKPLLSLLLCFLSALGAARADDQVLKLVAARDQAVRTAALTQNKRLLAELDKLRIARQRTGDKPGLAWVEAEITRTKAEITIAQQPVNGSVNPGDFRIALGSFNLWMPAAMRPALEVEERPGVLICRNPTTARIDMIAGFPLTGAFEAELRIKGNIEWAGIANADLSREQFFTAVLPAKTGVRTITIKRTQEGLISVEQDGAGLKVVASGAATAGMPTLLRLPLAAGEEIEIKDFHLRDLSGGKPVTQ